MDLKIKRAETLHKLSKLQAEYQNNKNGMPVEIAREFSQMLDQVEQMTNEIRYNDYSKQEFPDQDFTPTDGFTSVYNQNAAKKTLGEAFRMLASGERSKIDNNFLLELGQKNGLREYRTEYPSDNTVQTNLTNVFLELVKDDRFLSRIPTVTVRESYLKYPVVTRENFPAAEGKANADALTGSDTNFTSITLQPKNSYVLSRFHKDLIRDGGTRAYDAVWKSCREAITKRLVNGILFGSGSNAGEFNGLDNVSGASIFDTSGGSILDYSLVTRGAKALNDRFVDHNEMVGLISPNTYQKFSNLRELSTSGSYLFPPDQINMIPLISNAQVKQDYNTDKTRLYMMRPASSILALFGNFEMELNERYAEFDHAAALIVFRSDFAFLDPEHLFIATNLPTA
jgi:HK97 family phage major capsid protein